MNEKINALKNALIDYAQDYITVVNEANHLSAKEKNDLTKTALTNLQDQLTLTIALPTGEKQ